MARQTLVVPLRSNAYSLVAGAPISAVRRRLKFASIMFDQVLLEAGTLHVSAGPDGSSAMFLPDGEHPEFQLPSERHVAPGSEFSIAVGAQPTHRRANTSLRQILRSETQINWHATLRPFERELPGDCDWIDFVVGTENAASKSLADDWSRLDRTNDALRKMAPEQFVRSLIIKHANRDLALAADARCAVMQDSLHRQVVASRFQVDSTWRPTGFALPVLLPRVQTLDWREVSKVRNHSGMRAFRAIMQEVEHEALSEAESGDVEAATHHAYERYLADAAGRLDGLRSFVGQGFGDLMIGMATGTLTAGWAGPVGIAAAAAAGTAVSSSVRVVSVLRNDRKRNWLAVHQQLAGQ